MRAQFFGPDASTRHDDASSSRREFDDVPPAATSTSATARASSGCSPSTRKDVELDRPHRRAALARLGGVRPAHRLHRQRERHAQPARGGARAHARRDVHLHRRPTRSTATGPNVLPLVETGDAPGAAGGPPLVRAASTSRCRSTAARTACSASRKVAADLLVQEYGRYFDMPTVCFRGGCLTGPQHAGRPAARLPRLPDALHGHRRPVHDLRLRRQAGARQHPRGDVVRAFGAFHAEPAPAAVYNLGGGAPEQHLDARGDRACARRSPAASSTTRCPTRPGSATTAGGSATCRDFKRDYPGWDITLRHRGRAAGDPRPQRRAVAGDDALTGASARLSVVIPAHNEEGSIEATVTALRRRVLGRGGHRLRDRRRRRRLARRHRRDRRAARRERPAACAACATTGRTASASPCARGLEAFTGDAVAIVMADLLRRPDDLVAYHRDARGRVRLRVRLALHAAARTCTTTRASSWSINRVVNVVIRVLFGHGYNDTTNAFKAYRREVIETVQPLVSNHFNLTVELPLKAIVRGHSLRDRARSRGPTARAGRASCGSRRWAAATSSSC